MRHGMIVLTCCHAMRCFMRSQYRFPQARLAGLQAISGRSSQISHSVGRRSANDSIVVAVAFSPGFLKQNNPYFLTVCVRKERLVPLAGNKIINKDCLLAAVHMHFHAIHALRRNDIGYKQVSKFQVCIRTDAILRSEAQEQKSPT